MSGSLQAVHLKLERAQEHLVALDNEVTSWLEGEPYSISRERGAEGMEYVFRVNVRQTPPLAWSTIIGDCLQNMRSALDHLVWQLALSHTGSSLPANIAGNSGFPIFRDRSDFASKSPRMIRGISPHAQTIIEQLQPYHDASPQWDNLWILTYLARVDRHRVLHPVGAVSTMTSWTVYPADAAGLPELEFGPFEDGAVVARFIVREPSPEMNVNLQPTFAIAFGKGTWDESIYGKDAAVLSPASDILRDILNHIHNRVLPLFTPFF